MEFCCTSAEGVGVSILLKISASKKVELTGDCRKFRNMEIRDLPSSSDIIRVTKEVVGGSGQCM